MRLCALGWFGHRNAGDDRIARTLVRSAFGHHVTFLPFEPLPAEIVNYFDGIVLTAGNWHPRNRLVVDFAEWVRDVRVPLVACGLGVESMPPEAEAGARALVERAELLWLRDEESRDLLASARPGGRADHLRVGPDLTWADPLAVADEPSTPRLALNLRAWSRASWRPDDWIEAARSTGLPVSAWPLSPEDWIVLRELEPTLANEFRLEPAAGASVVVGMRLHSLIFASQMGVPAIGLSYDPKVRRFLESIGGEDRVLALNEPEKLPGLVAVAQATADRERVRLRERRRELQPRATALVAEAMAALEGAATPAASLGRRALRRLARWLLVRGYAPGGPRPSR